MQRSITTTDVGRWLRRAREDRRLSQQQVADELGIARPTVSQMEAGQRGVSSIELDRLARLYRQPLGYFLRPWAEHPEHVDDLDVRVVFRAETELLDSNDVADVLGEVLAAARDYAELERLLERQLPLVAPDYRDALRGRRMLPWSEGEWVAGQERNRLQLGAEPIHDVFNLIEQEGVKVLFSELREDVSGGCFSADETGPCIFLNRGQVLPRVRFTAAHEFAHILFDRDEHRAIVDRAIPVAQGSVVEQRANAFAAAFLMPEAGVRRYLDDLGIEPQDLTGLALLGLSDRFGASYPATIYRLQSLDLIDRQRRLDLEKERPSPVKEQRGTGVFSSKIETPLHTHRFVMLALLAYEREHISLGRLAELLKSDRQTTAQFVEAQGLEFRQGSADRDQVLDEVRAVKAMTRA